MIAKHIKITPIRTAQAVVTPQSSLMDIRIICTTGTSITSRETLWTNMCFLEAPGQAGHGGASTALRAKSFNLQEVALHGCPEMAFDVFGYLVHQAQIDFLYPAAFAADKVVVVLVFDSPTNEIAQLTVFAGCGDQNAVVREIFQDPIDGRQADAFEMLLQSRLHFERVEDGLVLQKQFDNGPHLRRDAMTISFEPITVIVNWHGRGIF